MAVHLHVNLTAIATVLEKDADLYAEQMQLELVKPIAVLIA